MQVWIVTTGEPLIVDGATERAFRSGLLADVLDGAGHEVTFWSSTFNHALKKQRTDTQEPVPFGARSRLVLLRSPGYRSNVSIGRIVDHVVTARRFREEALNASRPDIIVCSWPTIELSAVAVELGEAWRVPVVLDVRDLWPDVYLNAVPGFLRAFAEWSFRGYRRRTGRILARATAIVGITPEFVDWGVGRAGRPVSDRDRPFPLAYPQIQDPEDERKEAIGFWGRAGVSRKEGGLLVCFFGYFGRSLDWRPVVEVARRLAAENAQIVLCGTGERWSEVRARFGSTPNVLFPGWVDGVKIRALMSMADVGLAPYVNTADFQSSIPNKIIEYLSAGLPVVTSLRGVVDELVTSAGIGSVYVPDDPESLYTSLRGLWPGGAAHSAAVVAAKEIFVRRFDARKVYESYAALLSELVNDKNMESGN